MPEEVVQHCATAHRMCIPNPGNQKNLKVNTIYGIGGNLVFWFQRIVKRGLSYLSMVASCSQDQEISEYNQEIQQS